MQVRKIKYAGQKFFNLTHLAIKFCHFETKYINTHETLNTHSYKVGKFQISPLRNATHTVDIDLITAHLHTFSNRVIVQQRQYVIIIVATLFSMHHPINYNVSKVACR